MEGKKKVIFVDDDEDLLKVLLISFQSQGFEVVGLSNGKEAVEYLMEDKNLDRTVLIVLDRMLPDMDGIEILQKITEKYDGKFPVLFLSSLSAEKDVVRGLKLGAFDYVGKPFNLNVFKEKAFGLIKRGKNV